MATELDKLRRENAVLREALATYAAGAMIVRMPARAALAVADSIAAEPVEPTDAELVMGWVDEHFARLEYESIQLRDGSLHCELELMPGKRKVGRSVVGTSYSSAFTQAAAWVRAQKESES